MEVKDERSVVVSSSTILVVVVASTVRAVVAVVVSTVCVVAAVDVVAVVRCKGRIVTDAEKNLKMRYCIRFRVYMYQ